MSYKEGSAHRQIDETPKQGREDGGQEIILASISGCGRLIVSPW
jgi:hypothetical protein